MGTCMRHYSPLGPFIIGSTTMMLRVQGLELVRSWALGLETTCAVVFRWAHDLGPDKPRRPSKA